MPLNDAQFNATVRWLRNRDELRTRLDFIYDGLNGAQKTGLIAQIKADLEAEFDTSIAAVTTDKTDVTGPL